MLNAPLVAGLYRLCAGKQAVERRMVSHQTQPAMTRAILTDIFSAAVATCHPAQVVARALPERREGQVLILAAGKAASAMAQAVEQAWGPPLKGLVITRHGFDLPLSYLRQVTAGHPIPDAEGAKAAAQMLSLAQSALPDQQVVMLLSGGASSLLAAPAPGLGLADKIALTRQLLAAGAPIQDINCVRRHLSAIKGGRLAAICPAPILTLAISDVVGDRPEAIGSGPTVADPTTIEDAKGVLVRYRIADPGYPWSETLKPDDSRVKRGAYKIIASSALMIEAAASRARALGYEPIILGVDIEGEAQEIAAQHARTARLAFDQGRKSALISGGELTVTLGDQDTGSGGPNQEYALALAIALAGHRGINALAADSDGIDGIGQAAGGFTDPTSLARAAGLGLDPARALASHDSGGALGVLGDLFRPGPTQTNINDLRVILVDPI
jgi:hydroxypyruvate reductase